jgi:hypothetical protein
MPQVRTKQYSVRTYDLFESAMLNLFLNEKYSLAEPHYTAKDIRTRVENEYRDWIGGKKALEETLVRKYWNSTLSIDRSKFLSDVISEFIIYPTLDLFAGDCSVTRRIKESNPKGLIFASERMEDYPTIQLFSNIPFIPYNKEDIRHVSHSINTVILSAVLHHELAPESLLKELFSLNIKRFIILENCLTEKYDSEFHEFMDEFFNKCLNEFNCDCTTNHKTVGEWKNLFNRYGDVIVIKDCLSVPGIPFPYTLFVVENEQSHS